MRDHPITDKIRGLIRATIRTTWTLEALLFLLRNESQSWPIASIVKELRSSELAISEGMARLVNIGLVVETEPRRFRYRPANGELAELATALSQIHAERPYALIEEIASAQSAGIQDFADAFKLRKD
ncbi:MAG: hypothetical protein WAW96_01030 [Alphaproteobacteria bacterium]